MYTTLLSKMSVYELARQIELENYNTNNKKNSKNSKNTKHAASLSNKSNIVGTSECRCDINSNPRTMRRLWSICERGYLLLYAERVQCSVTLINLPSNLFKLNGRTGMIQYYNEDLEKYGKVLN